MTPAARNVRAPGSSAGLSGFLIFSQCPDRPDRYGFESRFDTMPSKPILQACLNTRSPGGIGVVDHGDGSEPAIAKRVRHRNLEGRAELMAYAAVLLSSRKSGGAHRRQARPDIV